MKRKLQEEEFNLMNYLASSIAEDSKNKKNESGECQSYGTFLTESLKKISESTRHIPQYHINNVLFQAQMGMLTPAQGNLIAYNLKVNICHSSIVALYGIFFN